MSSELFEDDGESEISAWAPLNRRNRNTAFQSVPSVEIHSEGRYRAVVQDLECMWRWEIHRDGEFVQEGCSLSESSSREAVSHVISFFQQRDARQGEKDYASS
jgi:soluble methane monooxygenase-binding protein MmoD